MVTVDAVVTGEGGLPVAGLGRDDFLVEEDGRLQEVAAFEAVDRRASPAPGTTSTAPPRSFLIVFDDLHLTPARAEDARRALEHFLEVELRDEDDVALVSTAEGKLWSIGSAFDRAALRRALEALRGRQPPPDRCGMTDYEALAIVQNRDADIFDQVRNRFIACRLILVPVGIVGLEAPGAGIVGAAAAEQYARARQRLRATLEALANGIGTVAGATGRKSVVLVSEGLLHDRSLEEFRRLESAARLANAAIYYVEPGSPPEVVSAADVSNKRAQPNLQVGGDAEGAMLVAEQSGGLSLRGTDPLADRLHRVALESETYYRLGYRPTHAGTDGRYHHISVRVRHNGLHVRARPGYFADGPDAAPRPVAASPSPAAAAPGPAPPTVLSSLRSLAAGLEAQRRGEMGEALRQWQEGLRASPRDPGLLLAEGSLYESLGSLRGPVWLMVTGAGSGRPKRDPLGAALDNRSLIMRSDEYYAGVTGTADRNLDEAAKIARQKLTAARRQFLVRAEEDYRQALAAPAPPEEAHLRLGRVQVLLGHVKQGRPELEWVLSHSASPYLVYLAHVFLGQVAEAGGDAAAAEASYRAAIAVQPLCQSAAVALAHLRRREGDAGGEREALDRALAASNERRDPWWFYGHGQLRTLDAVRERLSQEPRR
jgi:VWFA-related protein